MMTSELIVVTATSLIALLAAEWAIGDRSESNLEAEVIPIPVETDEN
ncbi:hypothetical protein [Roseofilum casamattae]|uniref:Uncharacterized protein n=1 Tax=Roseofilum casamattae BLCC-M143 TaxID=3022442 RepID=A0ABT7BSF6_9CYAN|nr:hypothetical protein [Roseofilum casamattae]MDJ1181702.1 hypothetical protein [Roseofilum casamattae BLCC-M143]